MNKVFFHKPIKNNPSKVKEDFKTFGNPETNLSSLVASLGFLVTLIAVPVNFLLS